MSESIRKFAGRAAEYNALESWLALSGGAGDGCREVCCGNGVGLNAVLCWSALQDGEKGMSSSGTSKFWLQVCGRETRMLETFAGQQGLVVEDASRLTNRDRALRGHAETLQSTSWRLLPKKPTSRRPLLHMEIFITRAKFESSRSGVPG